MGNEVVRDGYKVTEVGVIPNDWKIAELAEVSKKIQDGTHFSPKISNGSYRYITSKNVKPGYLYLKECDWISEEEHKKIYSRCDVKYNDVLLTKDGVNTGNAAINTLHEPFSLLSSVAFIRTDNIFLTPKFLLYYILSPEGQKRFIGMMSGLAITRVTLNKIQSFKVPLPPLDEQEKIAGVLSDVDSAIASLDKLITKKRNIKHGAMQSLLTGKQRLPGFSGEWEVKKFVDVTNVITCGLAATPKYVSKSIGVPFLSSTNVKNGSIRWNDYKYISKELHQKLYKNNPPEKGDILYSRVGTIGEAAIIDVDFEFSIYVSLI